MYSSRSVEIQDLRFWASLNGMVSKAGGCGVSVCKDPYYCEIEGLCWV